MKSRWWIVASLLVALTLLLQPGCQPAPELPMESSSDEDDLMGESMEMPGNEGADAAAETPAEDPKETPAEEPKK